MTPKWLGKKLLFGAVAATALIGAIACGGTAPAPAAPAAPQAPAAPAAPAAPQAAPAAPAAPAMQATTAPAAPAMQATTAPAAPASGGGTMMDDHDAPHGKLTIATSFVGAPNGLPRFCSASAGGCAEIIYMSGQTETLFNSILDDTGTPVIEPMLATEFTLDPSLEHGDFALREGVQFHHGVGEMTSEDVAFSFNDANSVTNPESVHGQAGDFAPLIQDMEAIDTYTVRLNYRNYDSRGMLHRFSQFWQTAGIVSSKVFADKGVEGMQDDYTGVGPFVVDEWTQQKGIFLSAFDDYYGTSMDKGPYVETVEWIDIPDGASRRAALEGDTAQIARVNLADLPGLLSDGYEAQRGTAHNAMFNISLGSGNYWESHSALGGDPLERDLEGAGTADYPYIGNPFEGGPDFDENTPSMQSARLVRNGLAWSIPRADLLENVIAGLGVVNHQPYLSVNNPNYNDDWSWGTDYDMGKSLIEEAGYADGFEMDLWIGTSELNSDVGEAVGAAWDQNLGVKVNFVKTEYGTFRPGLVARTNKTPFTGCGDENHSNFPYDWAHGFVMSSISAGGYGVGMEIPWAAQTYLQMAGEPDKAAREALASDFYTNNRREALCVGVFEFPIWPAYDPSDIETWDQRPTALGNMGGINNIRSIKLAH